VIGEIMAKPFKFRYVNHIAGAFAALIFLVLIAGFVLAAHAQKWFQQVSTLKLDLPPDGSHGLKSGADIQMLGTNVGSIDDVRIDANGKMTADAHVRMDFAKFIRTDSNVIIHLPFGLGDPFIEITRGQADSLGPTQALVAHPEVGAGDQLSQMIQEFRTNTVPKINTLIDQFGALATQFLDPHGPTQSLLANLNGVSARLQANDNIAGRILNDKQLADNLAQTIVKLNASVDTIGSTVASLRKTTDQLPDVVVQLQQTLVEVQKLLRGLEGLPLVRDYVDQKTSEQQLRPSDIGGTP
jgi:phospholipid/cholesterol/gamma-HCH transport system substrate-binding protein